QGASGKKPTSGPKSSSSLAPRRINLRKIAFRYRRAAICELTPPRHYLRKTRRKCGASRVRSTHAELRQCDTVHTSRCNVGGSLIPTYPRKVAGIGSFYDPHAGCNMSELSTIPALTTAIFLGGVVSGFSGFAFSAVAGVILLHLFEPLVAIPLMMCCSI